MVTKLVCEINWFNVHFRPFRYVTVVKATDVTFYLLTVLDALKLIQGITLSLIRFLNINRQFLRLIFAFCHFLRNRRHPHSYHRQASANEQNCFDESKSVIYFCCSLKLKLNAILHRSTLFNFDKATATEQD